EVQEAALRFREFIDSAQDLISIKGLDGRYTEINDATARFFDMRVEDCVGKGVRELYPPEIARIVTLHDREVIRRKEAISYEETLPIKGRDYYMSTVRFPLLDYKGDAVGVCTISRDVTQRKRLQRELVQSDKLAALGKLAMSVAHEINNPLTGILAYAEDLVEEAEEGDERIEDYQVIIRETLRCREIVRNLMDFSKPRDPYMQEADLNKVVERTVGLVERFPVFSDIRIVRGPDESLPTVSGDPHQLQQIVLNLLVNAAEHMPEGGKIEISTGFVVDGTACYIRVADTGPGIPEEMLGKIFEPFVSSKTATHGLGLAVSWGIVQRHGGTIEAGNCEEGGAEFRVVLPLREGAIDG
ncbi:MAG: two-component system sensor histidine kinase NtrB, partial [Planctomycetota bacterium]